MFNPTDYSISRGVNYAEIQVPGLQVPLLQFVRGESQTLQIELFLDGTDGRESVGEHLANLRQFVTIDSHLHAPPLCEFSWGEITFQGVVTAFEEKFALFDESGDVLRARVTMTLKSYTPVEIQARQANRQSPDRTKTRVVREGERLDLIAADEYGDPTLWTVIARENNLARPRLLAAGTLLTIPPL